MLLRVVGLGIKEACHLTLEGITQIREARKVLLLPIHTVVVEQLLFTLGVSHFENIKSLYVNGRRDEENYTDLFNKIIDECRTHHDIALLIPGHPRLGVTIVQWFEKQREALGITVRITPGISSFATMINDLRRDPIERGSVLIDANRLLLFEHPIDPTLDYYIYHICSIGTATVRTDEPAKANRLDLLKRRLLQYYPANHPTTLISSATHDTAESLLTTAPLEIIEKLLPDIHYGSTLFLTGSTPRKLNHSYLALLKNGPSSTL